MPISIIENPINKSFLSELAKERFGDLVKAVVDVENEIMAIGGDLHSDEETLLLERGSKQQNLWGINLYPDKSGEEFIEFDSVINIRPISGNRSRDVIDPNLRMKIIEIVAHLVKQDEC